MRFIWWDWVYADRWQRWDKGGSWYKCENKRTFETVQETENHPATHKKWIRIGVLNHDMCSRSCNCCPHKAKCFILNMWWLCSDDLTSTYRCRADKKINQCNTFKLFSHFWINWKIFKEQRTKIWVSTAHDFTVPHLIHCTDWGTKKKQTKKKRPEPHWGCVGFMVTLVDLKQNEAGNEQTNEMNNVTDSFRQHGCGGENKRFHYQWFWLISDA